MKKKLIGGFAVLVIAAVAALNVNFNNSNKSELSAMSLDNVEALAGGESTNCYAIVEYREASYIDPYTGREMKITITYCEGEGELSCG